MAHIARVVASNMTNRAADLIANNAEDAALIEISAGKVRLVDAAEFEAKYKDICRVRAEHRARAKSPAGPQNTQEELI